MTPTIRDLTAADSPIIEAAFTAQGWDKPASQYDRYWREIQAGGRDVMVAEVNGQFAGYVCILWQSHYAPFRQAGIPEIVDFNVLKKYQRRGIGSALMDEAERRIGRRSPIAGIGVGLLADYGPAQIMYIKRGYIPDGRGLSRDNVWPEWGDQVTVDDDLVLCFTKNLSPTGIG